jgi:hypothetical protein
MTNVSVAPFVKLQAKPGKESEVEEFLKGGLSIVQRNHQLLRGLQFD